MFDLQTKGDFINAVLKMDPRVKDVDAAIPLSVKKELSDLGVDSSMMATVYFKNGAVEVINVAAHWAQLINNQ